jgi:hypothetical protein
MADDSSHHGAPTRREYVRYGGTVIGGGLLAGCAGQSDSRSTPTEAETDKSTPTETSTPEDDGYSVTMEPVGEVTFESVPEEFDEIVIRQKARERAAERQNWQIHKDEVEPDRACLPPSA